MYISPARGGYDRSGQQVARRGPFLLLLQLAAAPCNAENIYACVRSVSLHQLGHFMLGRANINGRWYSISGAYGNDGLPMTVGKLPKDAKKLPPELYEAWNKGGGWNSAGTEAPALREWAKKNLVRVVGA